MPNYSDTLIRTEPQPIWALLRGLDVFVDEGVRERYPSAGAFLDEHGDAIHERVCAIVGMRPASLYVPRPYLMLHLVEGGKIDVGVLTRGDSGLPRSLVATFGLDDASGPRNRGFLDDSFGEGGRIYDIQWVYSKTGVLWTLRSQQEIHSLDLADVHMNSIGHVHLVNINLTVPANVFGWFMGHVTTQKPWEGSEESFDTFDTFGTFWEALDADALDRPARHRDPDV